MIAKLSAYGVAAALAALALGTVPAPRALAGAAQTPRASAPAKTKQVQMREALESANRVTVAPTQPDGTRGTVREIRGAALVRDLLETIRIDEGYGETHPNGPTDAVFTFFAGERPVAAFTLRRVGYLHWDNGPWVGDAALTPASSQALARWARQNGAEITAVLQDQVARQTERTTDAIKRFLADFNPEAREAFAKSDTRIYTGRNLRTIRSPLADAYADKTAFAEAALRALAEGTQPWSSDDWASGAVQTALLELEPAVVVAAMKRLEGDDKAILGAARFFLRCRFDRRLDASEANSWASRLADLALRTGRDSDKHTVLEYMARIPGDIAATFLRSVAQGTQKYTYTPAWDEIPSNIEEPSLPFAAAVLLATRADAKAAEIIRTLRGRTPPVGENLAALEVASAALDPALPLKPAHFKYKSHVLSAAAVDLLALREPGTIPVSVLTAACESSLPDIAGDAARIALRHGLTPTPGQDVGDLTLDFDPMLATTHPAKAITEYTALINSTSGVTRSRLLALRAQAHSEERNFAAAETDYFAAMEADESNAAEIMSRVAWVQWYLGKFDAARDTIERVMSVAATPELALLRGIMGYSQGDFQRGAESDFIAVMVMDPTEGYAPLFQHLAAELGGRPEDSRLAPFFLTSGGGVGEWPQQLFAYLLGRISLNRLFEVARNSPPNELEWHLCEANFYAAQMARIAGRTEDERTFLLQCIATDQPHVAEFWVAKYRLQALGASTGPTLPNPRLSPPQGTPPPFAQPPPATPRPSRPSSGGI